MDGKTVRCWVGAMVTVAAAGFLAPAAAWAGDEVDLAEVLRRLRSVEQENASLRQQVAALRDEPSHIKSDELRAMVKELIEKERAGTGLGLTAGYQDGHFFLSDQAGKYLLQIEGQIQGRYTYTYRDGAAADGLDEGEGGFLIRRAKVGFMGHILDPSLTYKLKAGFERSEGPLILEEAYLKYSPDKTHYVQFGQYKTPFLREELVSSARQLAVERSAVNELFTIDYAQGVTVGGRYDLKPGLAWSLSLHDGREQDNTNFDEDSTEFAVAGRIEGLLAGTWKQFDDFQAWKGDPLGVLVGVGADYAQMDHGSGTTSNLRDYLAYTADLSVEASPFNAFVAFVGRHGQMDGSAGGGVNQLGLVAQAGVFVIPDKVDIFARYEYIDYDGFGEFGHKTDPVSAVTAKDEVSVYTVGLNYYLKKHHLKFTVDVMWAPDGIRAGESGAGTLPSAERDEVVARVQVQLLF